MRRGVVTAFVIMALVPACGSDDENEADITACEFLIAQQDRLEVELTQAQGFFAEAAADGDKEAMSDAVSEIDGLVTELGGMIREVAGDATDDDLRARLDAFAGELESFGNALDSGEIPDDRGLDDAAGRAARYCGAE